MLVRFKRDWFSPAGALFRVKDNPNNVPDEFEADLPKDAEVLGAAKLPSEKEIKEAQERKNIADPMKKEVADVMLESPAPVDPDAGKKAREDAEARKKAEEEEARKKAEADKKKSL